VQIPAAPAPAPILTARGPAVAAPRGCQRRAETAQYRHCTRHRPRLRAAPVL
jgi:hypothetical protein